MMSEAEDASILGSNLTAVEAISAKLAEVTRLAEKLDARLCEAGARTRPMSIPTAVTSSASSLLSISAMSSPVTPSHTTSTAIAPVSADASASVTTPVHPTSSKTTSAIIASSSATSTTTTHRQLQAGSSTHERTASTCAMSTDAAKPVASVMEKPDESSHGVASHSTEDVQAPKDSSIKEPAENLCSESAVEEYNVENYATATECSTPTMLRSRSESFVTSPEYEDLPVTASATPSCSGFTWWTTETPKLVTTTAPVASAASNENQTLKVAETTSSVSTINGMKPTARVETMEKITDERFGRIVKEVTETTVLRVSHDIRLNVASYKLTSNTMQDHRQHTDAREIQNLERVLPVECREKTNGIHDLDLGLSLIKDSDKYVEKCPKKVQSDQNIATKFAKVREHALNESSRSATGLREYEDVALSTQDLLRHHEDSGIEMSPMKKDDNSEGEDFLERARKSGEWLKLKILEVQPELTKLGGSVKEATELSNAHDQVLLRLQNKQSPVEELLRQADQLISTQRPRAEVYTAMAETLGQAWRDVNQLLERRKEILERNVLFQCRAAECRESMDALEMACNDTLLPIEIEAVKNFLSKIQDLRKDMLEALMGALREGKMLLDGLKELANEGTVDSRPDRIKEEAEHAVVRVERWLEELHDRRRLIEASFRSRKTQLEQCLALALLATDLRDLEEVLNDRIAALAGSCDQLGDSASSVELLLFELKKLQNEAKEFQDRSIKITKSTERLVSSGHFAGEQATEQAYAILGAAADYVNDLDQYNALLNKAMSFFESARSAITKLDQLEIQLMTTEHPPYSTRLARFHAQTAATTEDVTSKPLSEGYALLDITGRGAPGAEGVKNTVEELESRKIRLTERCTAHKEENLEISRMLAVFLDKHEELRVWLNSVAKGFLQGHQDMGSDLAMACDFRRVHCQLLTDLEDKSVEVDHLELEILPIIERLEEAQKYEVRAKIKELEDAWTKTKITVAKRIELGTTYIQFHEVAEELSNEMDSVDNELKMSENASNEGRIGELERKWEALESLYKKLNNRAKTFHDEADNVEDSYLDISRACLCVQTILDKFANRQLVVTESWEKWQTTIEIARQRRIEHERKIEESTKTLAWVSKFEMKLYPVITSYSSRVTDILDNLKGARVRVLLELNKAAQELDTRIKGIQVFAEKGETKAAEQVLGRLVQMYDKVNDAAKDYEMLLESLISIFKSLEEIEHKIDRARQEIEHVSSFTKLIDVDSALNELDALKTSITESLLRVRTKSEEVIGNIRLQEPVESAVQDIEKLRHAMDFVDAQLESFQAEIFSRLEKHRRLCVFREDVERIDSDLRDLNEQLKTIDGRIGENLSASRATLTAFEQFEQTITILEERIETFVKKTEETIVLLAPQVMDDISSLRNRWDLLRKRVKDTKKRINLSIDYFLLLEEAKQWFREGSKLLVIVARKATTVKMPEEATELLREIDAYIKPGEEQQEKRIEKLKELSTIVFRTDRLPQFNEVVVENRQVLDSFAVVSSELRTLSQNLQNAEDLRERLRIEKLEADKKLQAAKIEMAAAEAAKVEAENARRLAEQLAAETLDKAATEAKRLKEQELEALKIAIPVSHSVSAQTDETVVEETVTSAVTTKEIHILQKMEIEKSVPVVQKEASPPRKLVLVDDEPLDDSKGVSAEETSLAPEFTVPLNDATVQEGKEFNFVCHLVGHPVPEIVWYKDGISILNNPDYLTTYVHGVCTLKIEETFAEDSAKYTCRAFNILGSTETSATLAVKETVAEEQLRAPVFVKELQPSTAREGCSHSLECTVEGNPLPTVQWYKNDVNIDNSPDYVITFNNGEAILKFDELFLEDKALYTCKATNRLGQSSTTASLDVQPAQITTKKPYFVVPLSNAMARTGQRVKLECEVDGNPMPELSWTRDGRPIEDTKYYKIQTDGARTSLIITEAFPKDAGCYTVTAKNDAGEAIISCTVSVKGRLPHETNDSDLVCSDTEPIVPKFQLPLRDLKIQEGRSARLDCVIVGQPEPEVIWYHDEQPVKESSDFQLLFQGDRCSLVIHEAFLDDAGTYKVVAINSGGEASSQCTLTVTPVSQPDVTDRTQGGEETLVSGSAPKFVRLPTDLLVAEGEDAVFECAVTGEPKPDLRWYSTDDGEVIHDGRIIIEEKEDGTRILKISSTKPEDKGNYVAKAVNIHGEAKAFARLVVRSLGDFKRNEEFVRMEEKLILPTFKEVFEDRRVPEGVSTKFECIVSGKPSPKIQWLFNDRPVHGKDFLVSVSGDRQVLTIPEVGDAHIGTITCIAENAAGRAVCSAQVEIDTESVKQGANEVERVLELVPSPPAEIMHPASSSEKHFSSEKTYHEGGAESQVLTKMSSTVTHSSTTSTKKEFVSSTMTSSLSQSGQEPSSVCTKTTVQSSEQSVSENDAPPVVQSHKIEEYEKIVQEQPGEVRQEKTVVVSEGTGGLKSDVKTSQIQKPSRKPIAPRFVSPITGMIVDQGADVVLEGIIDGFPQPSILWLKNGQELMSKDCATISYAHNHVKVELKNVSVKDAGRYTCTVSNEVGSASSTADLVVKKTIFPPVFGKRLKAQVVKKGDRVIMEVEITGIPEPTVTWYKNDVPINKRPPELRITQQGNCYTLLIEKVGEEDAGKYMVRATNAGGEAQSIADVAVFEPKPDTMVEVHKTVVYENVHDKGVVQSEGKKDEILSSTLMSEPTILIQPSAFFKPTATLASTTIDTVQKIDKPEIKSNKSETISSIIESHESETKSEQKFHMKLEHKTPPIVESKTRIEQTITTKEIDRDVKDIAEPFTKLEDRVMTENENIETSTIAKKDALSYFESITKESDAAPKGPKGMIKLTEDGQVQEAKVGELMKSYERVATSYEVKKPEPRPSDFQATKKTVQDIFTKLELGPSPRGVENKLFDFPYETPKLPPMEVKKTTFEDTTLASDSSQLRIQTKSSETMMKSFSLVPEPPPEICYMPKPEESKKKRPEVFVKAKQLQESFDKTLSPIEAPIGGVKIFPTPKAPEPAKVITTTPAFTIPPPFELEKKESFEETCVRKDTYEKKDGKSFKEEKTEPWRYAPTSVLSTSPIRPWSSSSDVETKSHVSTDLSEYRCQSAASSQEMVRSTSPKPSADGLAMEKSWAKKYADSNRKSWPPQVETAQKREWNIPVDEYKSTTREFKQEVEERPHGGIKKTSMDSSASVEKRSWSSKEEFTEKISEAPPPATKLGPIIYNAETIKVDHTVNTMQEKTFFEKRVSERNAEKAGTTRKSEEFSTKHWTHGEDLKAPSLVKKIEPAVKPFTTSRYFTESTSLVLEPGSPPEIGYIPPAVAQEQVVPEHIVQTKREEPPVLPPKDVRITPPPIPSKKPAKISTPTPTPTKFIKGTFGQESDYESDFDGHLRAKWRPYESDNEEPHYRKVKAPIPKQPTRPRSTEPEPLPPSKFETPGTQFAGPPRPLVIADSVEKTTKKTMFKRYEKESSKQQPSPIALRPGSPPIYVQPSVKSPAPKSPPAKKPESPKFKTKIFQQESGYMADTDEPFQQKVSTTMMQKSFGKRDGSSMTVHTESRTSSTDSRTKFFESHSYKSDVHKKEFTSPPICSTPTTPKLVQQQRSSLERSYASSTSTGLRKFESVKETGHRKLEPTEKILSTSPSPSRFAKGDFRESDYESDYDARSASLKLQAGSGKPTEPSVPVAPLIEESRESKASVQRDSQREQYTAKPKSVLLPGSPPELAYAPPQQYYETHTSVPYTKAIGTETKKTVRMDESTENARRVVTVEQTSRVIKFGDTVRQKAHYRVPTPKKFVQGQFRESDYESDVDSSRIRPKWAPADSDTEEPCYRRVQPPSTRSPRSSSAPVSRMHVASPMEFDTGPVTTSLSTQTEMKILQPGSPPEYGFVTRSDVKKAADLFLCSSDVFCSTSCSSTLFLAASLSFVC
ncbi:PREDICTED: uncharacterized protein LOC106750117 isoform X2 [Dinoponera quadriceps]|uniref:Uncharacterized protein LOC106750117 isoform X2 n=1 Tax=Dinoponera quadriceps TaxID=609295 RepID=A0A6P3Y4D7_DINQU|nr:PREDICTED: uncharacterized protein LOC106750117 isoform X2 [Dinoponera quadriceps]